MCLNFQVCKINLYWGDSGVSTVVGILKYEIPQCTAVDWYDRFQSQIIMRFRVPIGNRDGIRNKMAYSIVQAAMEEKKRDEMPHAEIGLKVHRRLYRPKSTQWYWDYSETQPKELRWNISRLTARLRRPPWIWTLRMAATDWALSQRAHAKNELCLLNAITQSCCQTRRWISHPSRQCVH